MGAGAAGCVCESCADLNGDSAVPARPHQDVDTLENGDARHCNRECVWLVGVRRGRVAYF